MSRPWTTAAGKDTRALLEANGFKRVGTERHGGRVLSEDFFNSDGLMVVINYSFVNENDAVEISQARHQAFESRHND